MTNRICKKSLLIAKLTKFIILSTFFACPVAFADGYLFSTEPIKAPTIKLINPKNSSDSYKNISSDNTSIPFNLRGDFDEADYFSSNVEDLPQANPPPPIDFASIPTPSEYKKVNSVAKTIKDEKESNIIKSSTNSIFDSEENTKEAVFAVSESKDYNIADSDSFEIIDDAYSTSLASYADVDLEGKKISKIKIYGLNTVSPEIVLNNITTQRGSLYNTDLLQKDLQKIYSTGYFSDEMEIEPVLNPDDTVELTFILKENILISKVNIIGNNVISTNELVPFVSDLQGKPQNLKSINASINAIHNYYHQRGYILASVNSVDDDLEGNLNFNIWEGIINKIDISGNEKTKDYIIKRNILTQEGTVYNEEYLRKDLAKIFSTQIFDEVNRDITPSEENIGTYNVTVRVLEKSTNSVGLGGGIDTGLGVFGSLSLKEDNFLGRAQKVSLSGIIGSGILLSDASIKNHVNYQAELSFFEPYFLNADNSLMAKLYYREMGSWNIPLAIERRVGIRTGIEHKVQGYDHLTTSFSLGAEHINLKEGDYNRISQLYSMHNLNIANRAKQLSDGFFIHLTPGVKYSNLDNEEIPREGIIAQAQFNEAIGVSNIHHTNGRLSGAVTKFFPVFKKSSFSLTGKAGIKVHGDDMPEIMAYRLGGPYSIRGFRMHGVGSGDSFVMGSAEFATPLPYSDKLKWDFIKKMRLTFFVDAGKVFDPTISNVLYDRPLHAITAGIGLRMYIPGIGPMSIDYGLPLINPGNYGSEHGYFTFGTGGLNGYGYGY